MGRARIADFVLGAVGLALIRRWLAGERKGPYDPLGDLRRLASGVDSEPLALELDVPELEMVPGYDQWSATYDSAPNPLIHLEEPVVRALIDDLAPGRALDAACGTGRHTAYLRAKGHRVIGVDGSPEMLARARERVPEADLRIGDLRALPVEDESVDLAVCALALTHVPDLEPAIRELARVVRKGGRIVVSDFHPLAIALGGQALFLRADGGYGLVQSYVHPCSEYLAAARAAGLEVERCEEPTWGADEIAMLAGPLVGLAPEAFRDAFVGLPGALVWRFRR